MGDFPVIDFTFHGEPVPAARPRFDGRRAHGNRHAYTPQKYRDYKAHLAGMLMLEYPEIRNSVPGTELPNQRRKYLKENRFWLNAKFYQGKRSGDIDNLTKSLMDALQDAGLIGDDSQVDMVTAYKLVDKANPRVELKLERI